MIKITVLQNNSKGITQIIDCKLFSSRLEADTFIKDNDLLLNIFKITDDGRYYQLSY